MHSHCPAFSAKDVTVLVTGSQSEQRASVNSLQQSVGASLLSGEGELTFQAPPFNSPDDFAKIQISATVAGESKMASFEFEFLPEIVVIVRY